MYATSKVHYPECQICKERGPTVAVRTIPCGDEECFCDYEAIVCEDCAKAANEGLM